ncbi:hypothetical protein D3C77_288820 [compost metagenome]
MLAQPDSQDRQGVDGGVQLAGGGAQGEQSLLGLVQAARLEIERVGGRIDAGHGLGRLDQGAIHRLGRQAQLDDDGVVALGASLHRALAGVFDGAQGRGQPLAQLVPAQQVARVGQVGHRLFRRAQNGAFARQFGLFVRLGIQSVEIGQVQRDLLGLGRSLGGGRLELVQMSLRRLQPLGGARHARQLGLKPAVVVEQGAMGLPVQQADRLVLAVHLDQQGADLAQRRHPGRLVVDIGAAAAVGRDHAAQDQLLARRHIETALGQERDQGLVIGRGKDGGGRSLLGARPHQAGVGARAQGQAQSVEDDGLTGAGLARQHGQAVLDLQVEGVDEDDVADREGGQHGRSDSRFRPHPRQKRNGNAAP